MPKKKVDTESKEVTLDDVKTLLHARLKKEGYNVKTFSEKFHKQLKVKSATSLAKYLYAGENSLPTLNKVLAYFKMPLVTRKTKIERTNVYFWAGK